MTVADRLVNPRRARVDGVDHHRALREFRGEEAAQLVEFHGKPLTTSDIP
jgi:hypothetical protein